jgi:vacuolar-type H+-ATPase subunit I/STV1
MKKLAVVLIVVLLMASLFCAAPTLTRTAPTSALAVAPTSPTSGDQTGSTERMTTRTAQMSMVVEDVTTTIDQISQLATTFQGYVVSSRIWRENEIALFATTFEGNVASHLTVSENERVHGTIAIRIRAEDYNNAINSLRGLAVEVTSLNSSSQDVTEEYVDLDAQLQNLETTKEQLLQSLAEAQNINEVLMVQSQVSVI